MKTNTTRKTVTHDNKHYVGSGKISANLPRLWLHLHRSNAASYSLTWTVVEVSFDKLARLVVKVEEVEGHDQKLQTGKQVWHGSRLKSLAEAKVQHGVTTRTTSTTVNSEVDYNLELMTSTWRKRSNFSVEKKNNKKYWGERWRKKAACGQEQKRRKWHEFQLPYKWNSASPTKQLSHISLTRSYRLQENLIHPIQIHVGDTLMNGPLSLFNLFKMCLSNCRHNQLVFNDFVLKECFWAVLWLPEGSRLN